MLSAETAVGDYPEQAVAMMAEIACAAEAHVQDNPHDGPARWRRLNPLSITQSLLPGGHKAGPRRLMRRRLQPLPLLAIPRCVWPVNARPSPCLCCHLKQRLNAASACSGAQTAHQDETSYEQAVDEAVALIKQRGLARAGEINCAGVWHALWSGRDNKRPFVWSQSERCCLFFKPLSL